MDEKRLAARLTQAKLVLGDIKETLPNFWKAKSPSPVGAVFCDVDLYSSTRAALRLFEAESRFYLPRVFCYFDDIIGSETELYNDYTGQRLAIREFNEEHPTKKLDAAYQLLTRKVVETWHHQIFIYHDFAHPHYNTFVCDSSAELPLTNSD